MSDDIQVIARNKKAYHDYFVLDTYEAGLELFGTEIKSIRQGRVNLKDSFCSVDDGEMFAIGMHISPFEMGNRFNRDPMRKKKLLLHKKEIMKLFGESQQQGLSIIPLELYIKKAEQSFRLVCVKAKSFMTSVLLPPKNLPTERLNVSSRNATKMLYTGMKGFRQGC